MIDPQTVERLVKVGCEAADIHLGCSYPSCACWKLPKAIQAALQAAVACGWGPIAEGWKLVPVEPTPEMVSAAAASPQMKTVNGILTLHQKRTGSYSGPLGLGDTAETSAIAEAYRAMLAASPPPPSHGA